MNERQISDGIAQYGLNFRHRKKPFSIVAQNSIINPIKDTIAPKIQIFDDLAAIVVEHKKNIIPKIITFKYSLLIK